MNLFETIVRFDMWVNTLLYNARNTTALKIFSWITFLGESTTIIAFTLITFILLWLTHKKWQSIVLWVVVAGSAGSTFIAKLIFDRPRPLNAAILETSGSFPSGHATIAVAFYGFLAYLLLKNTKSLLLRILIISAAFVLIVAIGFSRLYLGVHYPSDILAGYLVGLVWLLIGIFIHSPSNLPPIAPFSKKVYNNPIN